MIEPRQDEPNQFDEMLAWIEGDVDEHRNAGRHGLCTIEILMAIYESLRPPRRGYVPIKNASQPTGSSR